MRGDFYEQKSSALRVLQHGGTVKEACEATGLSNSCVRRYARAAGITPASKSCPEPVGPNILPKFEKDPELKAIADLMAKGKLPPKPTAKGLAAALAEARAEKEAASAQDAATLPAEPEPVPAPAVEPAAAPVVVEPEPMPAQVRPLGDVVVSSPAPEPPAPAPRESEEPAPRRQCFKPPCFVAELDDEQLQDELLTAARHESAHAVVLRTLLGIECYAAIWIEQGQLQGRCKKIDKTRRLDPLEKLLVGCAGAVGELVGDNLPVTLDHALILMSETDLRMLEHADDEMLAAALSRVESELRGRLNADWLATTKWMLDHLPGFTKAFADDAAEREGQSA